MQLKVSFVIALFSCAHLLEIANSENILFFAAVGTHSTRLSKWPLMEALAEKGHSVTYLSPFKNFEAKNSKVRTYEPKLWAETLGGSWDDVLNWYDIRKKGPGNPYSLWMEMYDMGLLSCQMLWDDPEFVQWVKTSKFDLVVAETYMNECSFALVNYWKAKLAIYSTSTNPPWYPDAHGLPDETSSIGDMITMYSEGSKMSFYQRFWNAISPISMHLLRQYYYFPKLEEIIRTGFGEEAKDMPSLREIEKNTTIIFMTQHYSQDVGRGYPPNIIPVGGNVVSKKVKPMPDDMAKFITESKSGFIYVSFGSVCDFTSFPNEIQLEFINALSSFKEMRFVWKSHNPINVTKIPENIFMTKWAPQQTVLAHPNIKAYITHSGMGSTTEAIHFSVPLVCAPVLADQDGNADMIVRNGAGVKVEIIDLKQKTLEAAVNEIIKNKKYREGMTRLTSIFKDRPTPPLENAVWWTEYVLRHDNVQEFLVHPSVHQSWWVRRQIDVWVASSLLLLTAVLVPTYLLSLAVKKVLASSSGNGATKKIKTN